MAPSFSRPRHAAPAARLPAARSLSFRQQTRPLISRCKEGNIYHGKLSVRFRLFGGMPKIPDNTKMSEVNIIIHPKQCFFNYITVKKYVASMHEVLFVLWERPSSILLSCINVTCTFLWNELWNGTRKQAHQKAGSFKIFIYGTLLKMFFGAVSFRI